MKKLVQSKARVIVAAAFAAIALCLSLPIGEAFGQVQRFGSEVVAQVTCTIAGYDSRGTIYNTNLPCGSGGGGSVVGVEPITADTSSPQNIGFDYSHSGTFTADQHFTQSTVIGNTSVCTGNSALPTPSAEFTNPLVSNTYGYSYLGTDGLLHIGGCSAHVTRKDALAITPSTGNTVFGGNQWTFSQLASGYGCLFVTNTGLIGADSSHATSCGPATITAGQNIVVTGPPSGPTVATTLEPGFTTVHLPQPAFSPGTLVGVADDGLGGSKLVQSNVSPCPTASCVVSVSGTSPITSSGGAMPNISVATPSPTCTGAVSCTGNIFGLTITGTPQITPSPQATGCGIVTGTFPYTIDTHLCAAAGPTPYPTPVVTASPPISIATSVVGGATTYTATLGLVPANLGGLGIDGTTFTNGQCAVWSSSLVHFVSSSCSGTTYSAGTNLSLVGSTFNVINAPVFSGTMTSANAILTSGLGASSIGACPDFTGNSASMMLCGQNNSATANGVGIAIRARDPNGSGNACEFWVGSPISNSQEGLIECSNGLGVSGPFAANSSVTFTSLTASKGVCTTSGQVLVACGTSGTGAQSNSGSCTVTSGAQTCTQSITVASGTSKCGASFNYASGLFPPVDSGAFPVVSAQILSSSCVVTVAYPANTTANRTVAYSIWAT